MKSRLTNMNKEEYIEAVNGLRKVQKTLNDINIWSTFAISSLKIIEENEEMINDFSEYPVPSVIKGKKVKRKPEQVKESIHQAYTTEIYKALVVYVVSLVEPVLMEFVRLTLLYDKRRLKNKPKGCEKHLDYDTIVDCDDYDGIVNIIISKYVDALSYSKPQEQLEYLTKLLSITIDDDDWNSWIEIKATRDLIVHNSGVINRVYLEKVGTSARGQLGEKIVVDNNYYDHVIIISKSLIGSIASRIVKELNKDGKDKD